MSEPVRVSLEADGDGESVRVQEEAGEVSTGEATFSFSIDGAETPESEAPSTPSARTDSRGPDSNDSSEVSGPADETTAPNESGASDEPTAPRYVAPAAAVPANSTLRCAVRLDDRSWEVILRRTEGGVSAWHNACPHRPEVRLDPGGGAIVDDGQVVCHDHGARFECGEGDDGICTDGPCRGEALEEVDVELREGHVYLTDERFDACRRLE